MLRSIHRVTYSQKLLQVPMDFCYRGVRYMDWFCNFHSVKDPIPEGAAILDVFYKKYFGSSEEPL